MAKKNKKGNRIEKFLRGEKGQRFFNFAYSIGAAIVIWGALFKILHLPGGSALLCVGMGTEIAMFIITAFDRPSKEYAWEQVFPELEHGHNAAHGEEVFEGEGVSAYAGHGRYRGGGGYQPGGAPAYESGGEEIGVDEAAYPEGDEYYEGDTPHYAGGGGYHGGGYPGGGYAGGGGSVIIAGGGGSSVSAEESAEASTSESGVAPAAGHGGVIIAGGGGGVVSSGLNISEEDTNSLKESISKMAAAADQLSQMAELTTATQDYLQRIAGIADQMTQLQETTAELNKVSSVLLDSYKAITDNSSSISESSNGYVESMADLNRNIGGLNTIYEIQLKSISSQLESIDRVNRGLKDIRDMYEKSARQSSRYCEETERMTRYMTQLNSVYEKMVTALTINMYNPMMGPPTAQRNEEFNPYSRDNGNEHQEDEN